MPNDGRKLSGHFPAPIQQAYDPVTSELTQLHHQMTSGHSPARFHQGYQSAGQGHVAGPQQFVQPLPIRSTPSGTRPPLTLDAVYGMLQETRDEIMELRGENMTLKSSLNTAVQRIVFLEKELDDLNQYNRRENVVFSNLKVEDQR